jgi:hypothetical protein
MTTANAYCSNATENVTYVFAVTDQRKEAARLSAQTRAFTFGKPAPHAVTLAVCKRVFEAIESNFAVDAHAFRGIARATALRKEQIGICSAAKRARLPVVSDFPHARVPLKRR